MVGGRFDGDHQILPSFGDQPWGEQILEQLGIAGDRLDQVPLLSARASWTRPAGRPRAPATTLRLADSAWSGCLAASTTRWPHAARELGVRVHVGKPLAPDRADVIATGLRRVDGLAVEEMFRTDAEDRVDVLLDEDLAPGGYAYLFISRG